MNKTPKEIFETYLPQKLSANPAVLESAGIRSKTVNLTIEGNQGGAWAFCFDGQGALSVQPAAQGDVDCAIEIAGPTFEGILKGSVNIPWAVVTRKIKIKGDAGLATKIGNALGSLMK